LSNIPHNGVVRPSLCLVRRVTMDARNTKPARRVVTVGEAASIYREARHTRRRNVRRSRQFVSAAACLCPLAALERMLAGTTVGYDNPPGAR
jgi:hypothetical protein